LGGKPERRKKKRTCASRKSKLPPSSRTSRPTENSVSTYISDIMAHFGMSELDAYKLIKSSAKANPIILTDSPATS